MPPRPLLELHDVKDGSAFCWALVRRSGGDLSDDDAEDLHAFLMVALWKLSERYEPDRVRKGFGLWANIVLRHRVVDWRRQRFGRTTWKFRDRTYERPKRQLVSLGDVDDVDLGRLVDALAGGELDGAGDRIAAELRRLRARACPPDW